MRTVEMMVRSSPTRNMLRKTETMTSMVFELDGFGSGSSSLGGVPLLRSSWEVLSVAGVVAPWRSSGPGFEAREAIFVRIRYIIPS